MRTAILMVGSYWYTAWVNAGQPNMKKLINPLQSKEEKEQILKEENAFQNGKALGRAE